MLFKAIITNDQKVKLTGVLLPAGTVVDVYAINTSSHSVAIVYCNLLSGLDKISIEYLKPI